MQFEQEGLVALKLHIEQEGHEGGGGGGAGAGGGGGRGGGGVQVQVQGKGLRGGEDGRMEDAARVPTCSTLVKHVFWCSLGVPKCMVRVTSVVPQSNWPPESSSNRVF